MIRKEWGELMICLSWTDFLCLESVSWLFIDQQMNLDNYEKIRQVFSEVFFIGVPILTKFGKFISGNFYFRFVAT